MKLGFGLYRHMLDDEHLAFAKQCGATHIIVHLCDYFNQTQQQANNDQPVGDIHGWGVAVWEDWTVDFLASIKEKIESHGLIWYGIENFSPAHWDHVLFNGPKKEEQITYLQQIIRNVGALDIKVFGYNFSLTGVTGRTTRKDIRGNAPTVGMDGLESGLLTTPLPNSMAWNMTVDKDAQGNRAPVTEDELWENLTYFLNQVTPVAEEARVRLAAHPDDPPVSQVRGLPKLITQPVLFQKLLDIYPSQANGLELCLGTMMEMSDAGFYEALESFAQQQKIGYIHLRNVQGKVPYYKEVFIDEGDIDIGRVLEILKRYHYDGVIIPDHSPQMSCPAPWHAGMAFAMGYLKAKMDRL